MGPTKEKLKSYMQKSINEEVFKSKESLKTQERVTQLVSDSYNKEAQSMKINRSEWLNPIQPGE